MKDAQTPSVRACLNSDRLPAVPSSLPDENGDRTSNPRSVEAQNQERMLLGFPRIESLLREGATAKDLVETAQQHGQNDDLTVISIAREA